MLKSNGEPPDHSEVRQIPTSEQWSAKTARVRAARVKENKKYLDREHKKVTSECVAVRLPTPTEASLARNIAERIKARSMVQQHDSICMF